MVSHASGQRPRAAPGNVGASTGARRVAGARKVERCLGAGYARDEREKCESYKKPHLEEMGLHVVVGSRAIELTSPGFVKHS